MSPDGNSESGPNHRIQVEQHLGMLHNMYYDKRKDGPTHLAIATLNQNIKEGKDFANQQMNGSIEHDKFDPSGNVKWGDSDNSGFLI